MNNDVRGRRSRRAAPPRGAEVRALKDLFERARRVKLLVLDVDGVLTDGTIWMAPDGAVTKRFDIRDGHGLIHLPGQGIRLAIISGRDDAVTVARARDLRFNGVIQGVRAKLPALKDLAGEAGVTLAEVAYMGDDINDISVIRAVGLGCAPADAAPEARDAAWFVSSSPGGRGAVRELCELILKSRGVWSTLVSGEDTSNAVLVSHKGGDRRAKRVAAASKPEGRASDRKKARGARARRR